MEKVNKYKLIKFGCILLVASMLTGCWDSVEVNNRSILLELAIDKNDDYTYDPQVPLDQQKIYRITYAIPDFGKLSGTESLAKDAETNIIVEAPSVGASIGEVEIRSKDTVTFSHVKAILLGESLLQDPKLFRQVLDGISRDMLIARNVPLLAVNGAASLTTKVENTEQPILGLYVLDYFNNKERPVSFFKKQLMGNFIREIEETGITTLPIFHIEDVEKRVAEESSTGGANGIPDKEQTMTGQKEEQQGGQQEDGNQSSDKGKANLGDEINISGAAVIKDYELVGYLSKEEIRSQLFIEGKIKNSPVLAVYQGGSVTYTIKMVKSKVSFKDTENGPICLVEIDTIGNIGEYLDQSGEQVTKGSNTAEIEQQIANQIVEQVKVGIRKSKEMNVDFMGIGLAMYRKRPALWEKYGPEWETGVYVDMPIEIGVNVDIQSTGIQE